MKTKETNECDTEARMSPQNKISSAESMPKEGGMQLKNRWAKFEECADDPDDPEFANEAEKIKSSEIQ